MNSFEKWYCGSALWRYLTRRELLPWMLQGFRLGDHILELGAGPGAATLELARRAPRVTSLEYDHALAMKLASKVTATASRSADHSNVRIVQGDAAGLPFPDATFSSAIAILMLHHLKSRELQDRTFSEVHRVLRSGGIFLAFDISDHWLHRIGHIKSTYVPVDPATVRQRLMAAGLSNVTLDSHSGGFRVRAFCAE